MTRLTLRYQKERKDYWPAPLALVGVVKREEER